MTVSTASDSSSDSASSESEGDDVPLSSLVERPSTPGQPVFSQLLCKDRSMILSFCKVSIQ